jgi:hypothetical protein
MIYEPYFSILFIMTTFPQLENLTFFIRRNHYNRHNKLYKKYKIKIKFMTNIAPYPSLSQFTLGNTQSLKIIVSKHTNSILQKNYYQIDISSDYFQKFSVLKSYN